MRFFHLLYLLLLLITFLLLADAQKYGTDPDFLNLRKKYRRNCLYKRCIPLHIKVPIP
ncbi:apelin receptor early endogenous ligand [Chanos chanos]|uniref:Apelin receptor early endogenous ligand n=1 Tax=Chanos chanos TaxID=29144 RepID=A0A6J2WJL7_CHACN|nr:apelin receptor early endogenous ligand [Chanos chanos]